MKAYGQQQQQQQQQQSGKQWASRDERKRSDRKRVGVLHAPITHADMAPKAALVYYGDGSMPREWVGLFGGQNPMVAVAADGNAGGGAVASVVRRPAAPPARKYPKLPSVSVNLSSLSGKWFEAARLYTKDEAACVGIPSVEYTYCEGALVAGVVNTCMTTDGRIQNSPGTLTPVGRPGLFWVQMDGAPQPSEQVRRRGNYQVVYVNSCYSQLIVASPNCEKAWIMTRSGCPRARDVDALVKKLLRIMPHINVNDNKLLVSRALSREPAAPYQPPQNNQQRAPTGGLAGAVNNMVNTVVNGNRPNQPQ